MCVCVCVCSKSVCWATKGDHEVARVGKHATVDGDMQLMQLRDLLCICGEFIQ